MTMKPKAFRLDAAREAAHQVTIEADPDAFSAPVAAAPPSPRRRGWGTLFVGAIGGLVTIAFGFWVERLVSSLLETYPAAGIAAIVLAGLALVAFVAILARELLALMRERRIAALHKRALAAVAERDAPAARAVVADLIGLYGARPETASARAALAAEADTIIDAQDRLAMAERALLVPLDARAQQAVANAARQVALVTAVSPRALIDVAFTLYAAARLVRMISAIYGGRPGTLGFARLARSVAAQLLVTGGMAAGDSLIGQAMGHGLAARLSAKAGEGVLNGLLTARIGLAAMAVCRPLPFLAVPPPTVGDVAGNLLKSGAD